MLRCGVKHLAMVFSKRMVYPVVSNYVRNTWGKFGLVKSMLNSSTGLFSFQVSSTDGLNSMLETRLWSSYARVMIELRADVELKDTIVMAMPKIMGEGYYMFTVRVEYEWKPPTCSCCVLVGLKVVFKPHKEYRPVLKKPTTSSSGNKKKGVEPNNEVSNSNPFEVLNLVDNDMELGTNGGTTNLVNNGVNSSGSFFMNIENSITSNTPIIDKFGKFKDLLISGQAILVDEVGNLLKRVEYPGDYDSEDEVSSVDNDMARSMASERVGFDTQSLLEQWRDSYGNGDYDEDPYDDDIYEGHDLS
ncbi:hypothetical protein Tco_0566276 [Tanacetum coccineum]